MIASRWKLAAGSALLALCSYAAFAQQDAPPPGPPPDGLEGPPPAQSGRMPGPDRELRTLTRELSLTADQQTGIKTLLEQQVQQMKALRAKFQNESPEDATPDQRQARRAQVEQIRDETDTKISALLNDEQKAKYTKIIQRRKARMAERGPGDGGPPPSPDGGGPGGPPQGLN
ncbi:Spy/CpxP family protein refolding chaperone [Acidicapsa dinghuensis]|uniref:Spy/CpxP family protein refolding chaperone n=1 Tax=Acidicapsa dinghuensis TaxID=2218256 RepID=A0ABW1EJH3_9BACT|nr:Spy/CpxP family protein refolding chaperone [Acidicapsa dinghuensis]